MTDSMCATGVFEMYRKRLMGLAYRMLGSKAEAEDVVQDAWLKWSQVDAEDINSNEAYLKTIVTRLCLDKIKRDKVRRESYVGPWLPEPIADSADYGAQTMSDYADDLSYALLLALERLSALERAAFILHDVFDVPFADVAKALERSEASARQLASRARKTVREAAPRRDACPEKHQQLLAAFLDAVGNGNVQVLENLLRDDVIYVGDGGGFRPTALRPIIGAAKVMRLFLSVSERYRADISRLSVEFCAINGAPGMLICVDGTVTQVFTITVEDDRIAAIYAIANPEKLAGLTPLH